MREPTPRRARTLGGLIALGALLLVAAGLARRWPMPILAVLFVALAGVSFAIWAFGVERTRRRA